jgi:hypothetical protein
MNFLIYKKIKSDHFFKNKNSFYFYIICFLYGYLLKSVIDLLESIKIDARVIIFFKE